MRKPENFKNMGFGMERNLGRKLIHLEQYIHLLNGESFASSPISSIGCMADPNTQDIGVRVNGNKFKILPAPEFNPLVYRGQNKDYPKLLPSSLRPKSDIARFLAWAQKTEFIELFQSTSYFTELSRFKEPISGCEFEFDLTAVAQHYEFDTPYLDFTRDVAVAMFFAYTKRLANGQYTPITDFEADGGYSPTLYVGNLKQIYKTIPDDFRVVGFQAVPRPQAQRAICLNADSEQGLDKGLFRVVPLPKSKEVATGIYEHCGQGALLFPPEQVDLFFRCSLLMQGETVLSELIGQYCTVFPTYDETGLKQSLLDSGYSITDEKIQFSPEAIATMQQDLEQEILPWLNNTIGYRGVAGPQAPQKDG